MMFDCLNLVFDETVNWWERCLREELGGAALDAPHRAQVVILAAFCIHSFMGDDNQLRHEFLEYEFSRQPDEIQAYIGQYGERIDRNYLDTLMYGLKKSADGFVVVLMGALIYRQLVLAETGLDSPEASLGWDALQAFRFGRYFFDHVISYKPAVLMAIAAAGGEDGATTTGQK